MTIISPSSCHPFGEGKRPSPLGMAQASFSCPYVAIRLQVAVPKTFPWGKVAEQREVG